MGIIQKARKAAKTYKSLFQLGLYLLYLRQTFERPFARREKMIEAIRKRRSIRNFLKREVEEYNLREVLKAAMFSPNSWGTRPWEFVVVKDAAMKKALAKASPHSGFVDKAPLVIVVCFDITKGKRFKEDSAIAAEHIHLEAVNQGLASCFVQIADAGNPVGSAEPLVKELLGIPEGLRVMCMMPIGYAVRELKEHADSEYEQGKVHLEKY